MAGNGVVNDILSDYCVKVVATGYKISSNVSVSVFGSFNAYESLVKIRPPEHLSTAKRQIIAVLRTMQIEVIKLLLSYLHTSPLEYSESLCILHGLLVLANIADPVDRRLRLVRIIFDACKEHEDSADGLRRCDAVDIDGRGLLEGFLGHECELDELLAVSDALKLGESVHDELGTHGGGEAEILGNGVDTGDELLEWEHLVSML